MRRTARFYPNRELAAHVLGYVGIDNVGLGGIEGDLRHAHPRQAGHGPRPDRRAPARVQPDRAAADDRRVARADDRSVPPAHRRARAAAGVESSGASAGSAVIMDPYTGEILALANYPTFNPNVYRDARAETTTQPRDPGLYEPGSTFKIVTASAALEEQAVSPDDDHRRQRRQHPVRLARHPRRPQLRRAVVRRRHREVEQRRRDQGRAEARPQNARRLRQAVRLRRAERRRTSAARARDRLGPATLTDSALASVAMGYQVGVTPLQMAAAVSAVANGGELVQPRVVRAVIRDGVACRCRARSLERVDQPRHRGDADRDHGGGRRPTAPAKLAQIDGYTVAGKTGTAKKLVNGSYRGHSDYNVSFVGFVPSRKPVFTIVVVVDSPHKSVAVRRRRRRADLPADRDGGAAPLRRAAVDQRRRRRCWPAAPRR